MIAIFVFYVALEGDCWPRHRSRSFEESSECSMMFHVSNRIKGRAIERIGAGMGEMRELEKELN